MIKNNAIVFSQKIILIPIQLNPGIKYLRGMFELCTYSIEYTYVQFEFKNWDSDIFTPIFSLVRLIRFQQL